jgi:hypothetical protein
VRRDAYDQGCARHAQTGSLKLSALSNAAGDEAREVLAIVTEQVVPRIGHGGAESCDCVGLVGDFAENSPGAGF